MQDPTESRIIARTWPLDKDMVLIYKIVPRKEWQEAEMRGAFIGSAVDIADGFIHFSTAEQLAETANKHFSGLDDLLLVCVDPAHLDEGALRFEISRGGALFPHLYGELPLMAVVGVEPFAPDEHGVFHFSEVLS